MARRINLAENIGKEFGFLTFLKEDNFDGKRSYILVKCICGTEKLVEWENLKKGRTKSCGCKMHPTTGRYHDPLYKIWHGIKTRCYKKYYHAYKYYGGKGVKVCDEWLNDFESFKTWCLQNGWQKGLHIDKDTKGTGLLYSPETCVILTHKDNTRASSKSKINMEIADEIKNSTVETRFLAKKYNLSKTAIRSIRSGKRWAK